MRLVSVLLVSALALSALGYSGGTATGAAGAHAAPTGSFLSLTGEFKTIRDVTESGGLVYFSARKNLEGYFDLYVTDGTPDGTRLIRETPPNDTWAAPRNFVDADGIVFFMAWDAEVGFGLWRSEGTPETTRRVAAPGFDQWGFRDAAAVNGILYFSVGGELWRSDGTEAGTFGIASVSVAGYPAFAPIGDRVLFAADGGDGAGFELWGSDGTEAGTERIADINPGAEDSFPNGMTSAGGKVFFHANDGASGSEPWVSDGTHAGTSPLGDLNPGPESAQVRNMVALGEGVIFSVRSALTGAELWASDGTSDGTRLLADPDPGPDSGNFNYFIAGSELVFFQGYTRATGEEPWVTDGTPEGTRMVADLRPGPEGSSLMGGARVGDHFYFLAAARKGQRKPWVSDGTAAGTRVADDVPLGLASSTLFGLADTAYLLVPVGIKQRLDVFTDARPPQTTVRSGPSRRRPLDGRTASFGFRTSPATDRVECGLRPGGRAGLPEIDFEPCTSPARYGKLRNGLYTVAIRARDGDGFADRTPAVRSFRVAVNAFNVRSRARKVRSKGQVKVALRLPGPGKLTVRGKRSPVRTRQFRIGDRGLTRVTLALTSKGKKRLRRSREARNGPGRLTGRVRISYRPTGGAVRTKIRRYTFVLT